MDTWRYNAIRVTKYNPLFRDANGNYLVEEWSSFGDVGNDFNGINFTIEEYLQIEQKYIDSIIVILNASDCSGVVIRNIEKHSSEGLLNNLLVMYETLNEEKLIDLINLPDLIKLILRENIWCELYCYANYNIVIRFGYDFYMYVNGIDKDSPIWKEVNKTGLFVG